NAASECEGKGAFQAQPLVATEESLESHGRPERTPLDVGALEHAHRARLLPQRSLSNDLELQTTPAGERPSGEMDALRDKVAVGTLQEIRAHAPAPSRCNPVMDQSRRIYRGRVANDQQDQ